jgi:hypothetical protein
MITLLEPGREIEGLERGGYMDKRLMVSGVGIFFAGFCMAEKSIGDGTYQGLPLSLSTRLGFDTEYVYRGVRLDQQVFGPELELSTPVFGQGKLSLGNKNILGVKCADRNKNDFYVGFSYDITDMFTADIGFTYRLLPNLKSAIDRDDSNFFATNFRTIFASLVGDTYSQRLGIKKHNYEVSAGLVADVFLHPAINYIYDFIWERHNIEGKLNYLYDLSSIGIENSAVNLSSHVGFDHTEKPLGMKKAATEIFVKQCGWKKSYVYYGANADLIYYLKENTKISLGVNYAGFNRKEAWPADNSGNHRNFVWLSALIACHF